MGLGPDGLPRSVSVRLVLLPGRLVLWLLASNVDLSVALEHRVASTGFVVAHGLLVALIVALLTGASTQRRDGGRLWSLPSTCGRGARRRLALGLRMP